MKGNTKAAGQPTEAKTPAALMAVRRTAGRGEHDAAEGAAVRGRGKPSRRSAKAGAAGG